MTTIFQLLKTGVDNKASDLHLSSGSEPILRINGEMRRIEVDGKLNILNEKQVHDMLWDIMNDNQKNAFERDFECDFSFALEGVARFRVNVFKQSRGMAAVLRTIPEKILTLEELGAPPIFAKLMHKPRGLILVTGPTGSGKSTTLAAMIDYYNTNFKGHVLTVEDPIEFVHSPKKCLINQRELGENTLSFANALKSALREDPDVILVGEMRDLETISLALTAAETGHLVLGTLHSSSAAKTINRIIDVFPEGEKTMVRAMLGESIEAIISQSLVRKKEGSGRVAAHEILVGTPAVRNLIKENKIPQIYSTIQTSGGEGMITLESSLKNLVMKGKITQETARAEKGD